MQLMRCFLRLLPLLVLAAWPPAAAAEAVSEYALRAVLLHHFLQFAELPANGVEREALVVCVASRDDQLLAAMAMLRDRPVRGLPLVVKGHEREARCDAIFVDSRARWQFIADKPGVLTIGAYPGFLNDGGMIEIDLLQSRPRFDVSLAQARKAGIRLYPQLLRLARRVIE